MVAAAVFRGGGKRRAGRGEKAQVSELLGLRYFTARNSLHDTLHVEHKLRLVKTLYYGRARNEALYKSNVRRQIG